MPIQLTIRVQASDEANAYVHFETGRILVTTKLLEVIGPSEGEVAFVVAHEAGHALGEYTGVHRQMNSELVWRDQNTFLGALNRLLESDRQAFNRYHHPQEVFAEQVNNLSEWHESQRSLANPHSGEAQSKWRATAVSVKPRQKPWVFLEPVLPDGLELVVVCLDKLK
jgi:predicted Zn-dependent protease